MNKKRQSKTVEWTRNLLLILLAGGMVVIFFNLDMIKKGESVFSHHGSRKLKFQGALGPKDFSEKELDSIEDYIKVRDKLLEEIIIQTSVQDTYREVTEQSDILFEMHVTMEDGFEFITTLRRTQRKKLPTSIVRKLDKDIRAYLKLKKEGRDLKGLINTM